MYYILAFDTISLISLTFIFSDLLILVEHPEPSTYIMDFALVSDSDDEDGKVVCFICPLAFSNLSDAEHHFKEKHTDGLKSEKSIGIQDSTF